MSKRLQASLILAALLLAGLTVIRGDPFSQNLLKAMESPSGTHLLGRDHLGRDFGARLARGALKSLSLSLVVVCASFILGITATAASMAGRRIEMTCLIVVDMVMAFPGIVLAVILSAVIRNGQTAIVLALTLTGWTQYFRVAHSMIRQCATAPHVEAATLSGMPGTVVFLKYVFPELASVLGVMMALSTGKTILEISSLGFLGIGVAPPMPELGSMISEGIAYMRSTPRLIVIPGAVLSLLVFSFLLLGNQDRNGEKERPT